MSVIFITRFSIPVNYDTNSKNHFQLSKECNEMEYLQKLYSKERMERKMNYFKQLCFPSITKQTNPNWKWYIMTSQYLPFEYLMELETMIKPFTDKIKIHFVADIVDFKSLVHTLLSDEDKPFITSRIDDDDGISLFFVEKLLYYLPMDHHIINFVNGIATSWDEKNHSIQYSKKIIYYNNSVGLSFVNGNVYSLGNHVKINQNNNIIYNVSKDMFFLTHDNQFCDTHRKL